jgi:hypothetical protein
MILQQFNNYDSIHSNIIQGSTQAQTHNMSIAITKVGLLEAKSDNVIHFQDPRSAKYNGAL